METQEHALYVVDANVVPTAGSELLEQYPDATGAFLKCFVKAGDALDAGNKVKAALEADHYSVIRIDEILLEDSYESDEWEPDILEIVTEAKNDPDSEVYYGSFYCYLNE